MSSKLRGESRSVSTPDKMQAVRALEATSSRPIQMPPGYWAYHGIQLQGRAAHGAPLGVAAGDRGPPHLEVVPVQRRAAGEVGAEPAEVHETARRGLEGPAQPLPHKEAIQRSFGRHSVGGIQAHVGGSAGEASQALSALAYARGNEVAFQSAPDLHTAAHEAAHVIQQRGGVQLAGGLGTTGDRYEQHADAVADAVVRGQSAEALLDGHGDRAAAAVAVQCSELDDVKAVKSKAMEDHQDKEEKTWPGVVSRQKHRETEIDELLKLKPSAAERAVLQGMKGRWDKTAVTDANFDPVSSPLNAAALRSLLDKDKEDIAKLSGRSFKGLRERVSKLREQLTAFLKLRQALDEEQVEFHRFDNDFVDADVMKALAVVPGGFRPADLKAMLAQETGDFTDTRIAGIAGKKTGIKTKGKPNPSFVGVGQINNAADGDARKTAKKLGIKLPPKTAKDDPRKHPDSGIKIAANYLAYIGQQLTSGLPATPPTGVEMRKLVLAAYNGGPFALIKAANQVSGSYTWQKIRANKAAMSHFSKPGEVADYVQRVTDRAP